MNCSVYLFGDFGKGYTQYPDDYAQGILRHFYDKSTAETQVAIHRNDNLMYYGYVRKIEKEKFDTLYIGFCVLLNGMMFTNVKGLFLLFEDAITNLVVNGNILEFNDNGNIVSKVDKLYEKLPEVDRITDFISNGILKLGNDCKKMPPVSYGIVNDEIKKFTINDDNASIIDAACRYSYTYIYKTKDYNTQSLSSYKSIISRLNKEKQEIANKYTQLSAEYQKMLQQKKQYKKVILLCLLVAICGIGLFVLKNTLDGTKHDLVNSQATIAQANSNLKALRRDYGTLQKSLGSEQNRRELAETALSDIGEAIPILITNIEIGNTHSDDTIETNYGEIIYSSRTMYLKPRITYKGMRTGEDVILYVKFYTPSGMSIGTDPLSDYSYSTSIHVLSGENVQELGGWGNAVMGTWAKGLYRFEIWYNDICLKAKSFTIF